MKSLRKMVGWNDLRAWRMALGEEARPLVVTNGCFDLLHAGHVSYLEEARELGRTLLVGVNTDRAVKELKGPGRPIYPEAERALLIAALEAVSAVCIFPGVRAAEFLAWAGPDIYVKGGDYRLEDLPAEEVESVKRAGGRVAILGLTPARSTTSLIEGLSQKR